MPRQFRYARFAVFFFLVAILAAGLSAVRAPSRAEASVPTVANAQTVFPGGLWRNPDTVPATAEQQLRKDGRTTSADLVHQISSQPIATWLSSSWSTDLLVRKLKEDLAAAEKAGKTPVFVAYAIPDRDCGGYSAGGFSTSQYKSWSQTVANTLSGHNAVVLVEPDSISTLGNSSCAPVADTRLPLLRTVIRYYARANVAAYLDGGFSGEVSPDVMIQRLRDAGVQYARGFFTNVSNFDEVQSERDYAGKLSSHLGGKKYVIDVSRNGNGKQNTWCNPTGAALGQNPHVTDGTSDLDALLWVKTPGVSDGTCNGGPAAGKWFESSALSLVRNRH